MIKKIEDLNYYELLEIKPTATTQEILRAYERVRRVYEPNSVALYSLFTPEETAAIHQRIEEAYRTLVYESNRKRYDAMLREQHEFPELPPLPPEQGDLPLTAPPAAAPRTELPRLADDREFRLPHAEEPPQEAPSHREASPPAEPVSQFIAEFTGPAIKMLREQKGMTLRRVADITKVSLRYLEFIEAETYEKLPARAYIRGFLTLYAKALGCDSERMVGDYIKRYDAATGYPHSLRKKPL